MELERAVAMMNGSELNDGRHTDFGYGLATAQSPVWTLDQVLLATGGRVVSGNARSGFRRISTDTRSLEAGDLFLALSGARFDGESFVGQAIRQGAAGLVVTQVPEPLPAVPVVVVDDTLKALGDLAAFRRSLMRNLKVLAITGSSGKTTVKEMCAAILDENVNVLKTKGNFNNLIGLPLSLLDVDSHHAVAVLEMGMNQAGEIARLTEIADPDIACIHNIQDAHIQGLVSIDGVAMAKGELFSGMKSWGRLAVNLDDKRVRKLARRCSQKQITYGRHRQAFVRATRIHSYGEEGMAFTLHLGAQQQRLRINCFGKHNISNALAAAALAYGAGLQMTSIVRGLCGFTPFAKRLQVEDLANGLKVVDDTYNANPASMVAALDTLQDLRGGQKSIVVLGDMLELGEQSGAAHKFIGETVARLANEYLFAVGDYAEQLVAAAVKAGMKGGRARAFSNKTEVLAAMADLLAAGKIAPGDWLLVKGSRGMEMETIINDLKKGQKG